MPGRDVSSATFRFHGCRPLPFANQRESYNDRIRYRAVISHLSAYPAAAKMVGWLDSRAGPGGQPGVLAYRAQTVFGHRPAAGTAVRQRERVGVQEQPVTQTDVETELQLVTSAPVQQAVRARLNSTPAVSASEVGQTNVMAITATSGTPSQASLIANVYATAFVQYQQAVASHSLTTAEAQLRSQISSLEQQLSSFGSNTTSPEAAALLNQEAVLKEQLAQMQVSGAVDTGDVVLVTPAQTPVSPSSPKPVQDALLGLAAGLALGLGAAFLRDSFDDRLTSKEATERAGGAPVLAMTPLVTSWRRQKPLVVTVAEPNSPAAESYRSLRTSLQFARQEQQLRSLRGDQPGCRRGQDRYPGQPGGRLRPGGRAGGACLVRPAQAPDRGVLRAGRAGGPDQRPARPADAGGDGAASAGLRPAQPAPGRPGPAEPRRTAQQRPRPGHLHATAGSLSTWSSSTARRCCRSPTPRSCPGTRTPR